MGNRSALGVSPPPSPPYPEQQKPFPWAEPDNEDEEKDRAYMALSPSARIAACKVTAPDGDDDDDEHAEAGEAREGAGKATLPNDDDDDDDDERADDGCWPWCNCVPAPGSQRASLAVLMNGPLMSNASMGLVVLNMTLMCMPYEGMSDTYAAQLESSAKWITWIFIIEMGLKLFGMGCRAYWSDGWNQLDGIIVIMSIVEIVLTALFANSGPNMSFLRILRMLRVARMLRLMRSWVGLYKIISTVVSAVPQMLNVLLLMFLICTIFALLGMQLFGGVLGGARLRRLAAAVLAAL